MRRRLWWHLWAKDIRASEDHGITVSSHDFSGEIDFPLNVDDNELDPAMSELPPSKSKWAEMTYPLIVMKANHALQELSSTSNESNEPTRREAVRRLTAHIEEYSRNCNPNIPIQRATMLFTRIILRKLDFVSHQQLMNQSQSQTGSKPEDRKALATEEHLVSACEILESNLQIRSDDLLRGFRWAFEAYPQYHLLLYVLWHLCVKPSGPNVGRAWYAVEASFGRGSTNAERDTITVTGPKLAILEMMRKKAMQFRQTATATTKSHTNFTAPVPTDEEGQSIPAMDRPAPAETSFDDLAGYVMSSDVMNWTHDSAFPDWNTLIDDFNMHPPEFGSDG